VSGNVIDAGDKLPIDTGPTHENAVANNEVATSFPFIYDGGTEGSVDGLPPAVFGPPSGGFVAFSIAGRGPKTGIDIFPSAGKCHGNRVDVRFLGEDHVIADDDGAAAKSVQLGGALQADEFVVGTTQDPLGTPDLPNPCPLPAPAAGAAAGRDQTPPEGSTASSTTPALASGPTGVTTIPVLNLNSPFLRGFRIIPRPNGLDIVILNPNAFPTAYDIEATAQMNLRFRAAKAGTFALRAPRFTLAPNQSKRVRLKYTRAAKRYIARKSPRRARVRVAITERATGGSKRFSTAQTVTVKRANQPKRKKP
jgi:hypothetical protein